MELFHCNFSHLLAVVKCLFWKGVIISPCAELCDTCQFLAPLNLPPFLVSTLFHSFNCNVLCLVLEICHNIWFQLYDKCQFETLKMLPIK